MIPKTHTSGARRPCASEREREKKKPCVIFGCEFEEKGQFFNSNPLGSQSINTTLFKEYVLFFM